MILKMDLTVDRNVVLVWHGLHDLTKGRSRINLSLGTLSKKSKIVVRAGKLHSFKWTFFKNCFLNYPKDESIEKQIK